MSSVSGKSKCPREREKDRIESKELTEVPANGWPFFLFLERAVEFPRANSISDLSLKILFKILVSVQRERLLPSPSLILFWGSNLLFIKFLLIMENT